MKNLKKDTFKVQGMVCAGCEGIVEAALSTLDGVSNARANLAENSVEVTYDPLKTNYKKMNSALQKEGYRLLKPGDVSAVNAADDGEKPASKGFLIGTAVVLLALYLIIDHSIGFNFIPEVTSSMGYGVLFVVGLFTSLHCVAMCGGINMSQCVAQSGARATSSTAMKPSLFYNLGRVASYTVIGGIVGALGSVISFSGWARGIVAIVSGLLMILMGIGMMGIFPWLNAITPRLPRIFREKANSAGRGKGPFAVGLLNGLMPCGPLQAMQVYALGTGSLITGALSMFFFSLGTLPLMFGLGAIISVLGSKFTKKMMTASAALVAVLGVVMFSRGLALSDFSVPPQAAPPSATAGTSAPAAPAAENQVQKITSTLTTRGYPNITVKKGVPVEWTMQADAKAINGCNKTFNITDFQLQVKLKPGDNVIRFTPTESKTITYFCWMGMQSGKIQVVD